MLDPIDPLSEMIFSILIVLTFTLAFRIFKLGNDPGQVISAEYIDDLLIGALGATLASGLIDGIMYALMSMFERCEKHRLLLRIQTATTQEWKSPRPPPPGGGRSSAGHCGLSGSVGRCAAETIARVHAPLQQLMNATR